MINDLLTALLSLGSMSPQKKTAATGPPNMPVILEVRAKTEVPIDIMRKARTTVSTPNNVAKEKIMLLSIIITFSLSKFLAIGCSQNTKAFKLDI